MKIYLDCYPCFIRQALHAARLAKGSPSQQHQVVIKTMKLLEKLRSGTTPPEMACHVHRIVREEIFSADPYQKVKQASTQAALDMYPKLKQLVSDSEDPLDTAIRISIAGNIIDFGVSDNHHDLWETVEKVLSQQYEIDDGATLRSELQSSENLLFLADNAGETVFDRVLIEQLPMPVTYAVKGAPTLNDATTEDASAAGVDSVARVVDNGTDAPGTILSMCSPEFLDIYKAAPLIIAKGQANYESLSSAGSKVFCLLQIKCPVIAKDIGAPVGGIVIRQSTSN
ncbi:MAG: ARMT1-like domain-containing protein [Desulfobacterales bacterium]